MHVATAPRAARSRQQRQGVLAILTCALVAVAGLAPAAASAHKQPAQPKDAPATPGSRYLALGDSVVFGYREPDSQPAAPDYSHEKAFVGYPELVGANLRLHVTNAACPGETTASFVDTTAQSNGCENTFSAGNPPVPGGYRTQFPLHVTYRTTSQSQLAYAERFLRQHPNTRLVTLMVGANDGFVCQKQYSDGCVGEIGRLQKQITARVTHIFKGLRKVAHYRGQLVLVTYYAMNYADSVSTFESQAVNTALKTAAKGFDVRIANGYREFRKAARNAGGDTCAAGLLTNLTGDAAGTCGVHPSYAGAALLAQAVEQAVKR